MLDKLTVVQAFHERVDIVQAVQAFHEIVNRVIAKAINSGIHSDDRVLLLLTETDPASGYWYDGNNSSHPHSSDGRLIMPFGKNEKGQRQFLVSFDPTGCDDKNYPDLSFQPGWDWEIYKPQQAEQPEVEQPELEQPELEKIDPTLLIHIGDWSLRPIDIKWISWDFESSIHGYDVTTGALNDNTRILFKASEPTYTQDLETLEYVTNSANWIPRADWLVNHEDKLVKRNR